MMMRMVMSPLERQRKGKKKKKRREKRVSGTLMIKEELEVEERIEILETKRERELNAREKQKTN